MSAICYVYIGLSYAVTLGAVIAYTSDERIQTSWHICQKHTLDAQSTPSEKSKSHIKEETKTQPIKIKTKKST